MEERREDAPARGRGKPTGRDAGGGEERRQEDAREGRRPGREEDEGGSQDTGRGAPTRDEEWAEYVEEPEGEARADEDEEERNRRRSAASGEESGF